MKLETKLPIVYLITKGESTDSNFDTASRIIETIKVAVESGVDLIQIREKKLSARNLFKLTRLALEAAKGSETRIMVNDRVDVALSAGADGVHLPADAVPIKKVREMSPDGFLIGVSTHDLDEVKNTVSAGADFAVFGPVFATPGKSEPVGVKELSRACDVASSMPVLALGGVDETNYAAVKESGARGFAAIRVLNDIRSLRSIMELTRREHPSE